MYLFGKTRNVAVAKKRLRSHLLYQRKSFGVHHIVRNSDPEYHQMTEGLMFLSILF